MTDRIAIVTGGTRGIGAAIGVRLKEKGRTVIASYGGNDEAAQKFKSRTGIEVRKWNVGDHEECIAACADIEKKFGAIDIMVNNAGITRDATLMKMSYEQWEEVLRVDLSGCFNMAKASFPGMRERGWGRIVNVGSVNGQGGQIGQVNYAAAKSGIHGFTKSLAMEGARYGVTVNAIAPGYIATDMLATIPGNVMEKIVAQIPIGRLGKPDEIARGVEFLTSENASFVTGSTLSINGGQHMY
ncbi:MAG: acetoacetyl-CoA reductase [Sphingorhabdus sp.]